MNNRLLALTVASLTCVMLPGVSHAAITGFSSYTIDASNNLTSFTVASGTVSDLAAATSVGSGGFSTSGDDVTTNGGVVDAGGNAGIDNLWVETDGEIDGAAAILNLDLSSGVVNAGNTTGNTARGDLNGPLDVFFGVDVLGQTGASNDIFIMEMTGNDLLTIQALNSGGSVIGDQSIVMTTAIWGGTTSSGAYYWDGLTGSASTQTIQGIAFDVDDFFSGSAVAIAGIRISNQGLDAVSIGYSEGAVVPEPGTYALLSGFLALSWVMIRRRK